MTALTHSAREQWLMQRRELVTASDVAAILGVDKNRDALAVFADKLGLGETEENEAMLRGRDFEDAIGRTYARQTRRAVSTPGEYEIQIHPIVRWLGATLDRRTLRDESEDETVIWIPLQLKMALGSGYEWREEPPRAYVVQVQIEIQCDDKPMGVLAGLVGPGPLSVADILRDQEFFDLALPVLERFLWHVQTKTPPEPQSGLALEPLKRLWPRGDGHTITLTDHTFEPCDGCVSSDRHHLVIGNCHECGLPPEAHAAGIAATWESKRSEGKRLEEESKAAEARLRHMLGGAQYGDLGDGSLIERKIGKRSDTLQRIWPKRRR